MESFGDVDCCACAAETCFGSVKAQFSHGMARLRSASSYVFLKLESLLLCCLGGARACIRGEAGGVLGVYVPVPASNIVCICVCEVGCSRCSKDAFLETAVEGRGVSGSVGGSADEVDERSS